MNRLTVLCFLISLTILVTNGCPKNEEYSKCGNNACQNTCKRPNISKTCKPKCVPGCICIKGYLRNTKGLCVPAAKCDTCGPNEIFDLTKNTECANTCAQPDLMKSCKPKEPIAGCICKKGYVTYKKKCILLKDCPPKKCPTDRNAIVLPCGDPCPRTCDNKDEAEPRPCPQICITDGCKCKDGYVLDKNNKCILEKNCPPKICPTDPNATVEPCGDPCPRTCDNKDEPEPRPCTAICITNGCKCKDGYVLNEDNTCILEKNCPPKNSPTGSTTVAPLHWLRRRL